MGHELKGVAMSSLVRPLVSSLRRSLKGRGLDALNALIAQIFSANEQGAFYVPRPTVNGTQVLFQDAAGTEPVTADGDPVGRMIDQSSNNINAAQSVSSQRPTYNANPDRLSLDKVDDKIIITVPAGGWTGTMVLATDQGTASYGIDIPAGDYEIGEKGIDNIYFPGTALFGAVFRDGALTAAEKTDAESYFVGNGATSSYGDVVSFEDYWRGNNKIVEFPLIDTSSGTRFRVAWYQSSLLEVFPANSFDNIKGGQFELAFIRTNLNQASIDGILVSLVTSGIATSERIFDQSGGSAPSSTGEAAIDTLRSRGWTVAVTGGY